jgi:hypothetical protein
MQVDVRTGDWLEGGRRRIEDVIQYPGTDSIQGRGDNSLQGGGGGGRVEDVVQYQELTVYDWTDSEEKPTTVTLTESEPTMSEA